MFWRFILEPLRLEFVDSEITAWGGLALLKILMDQSGFQEKLSALPFDVSRFDTTIQKLFGWDRMPEHKAFQRYFRKFSSHATHEQIFGELYRWFFSNIAFDNFTLDIDSSVITRHGNQDASCKGYNPRRPGRNSHHPLIAFVADVEMVANFWLRSGDAHTANNFQAFLEETLSHFVNKKIGLFRLDSGFYSQKTFDYLEKREQKTEYIVAVPMHAPVQRKIAGLNTWMKIENGIEICEFEYQAPQWCAPRRMISVRQKVAERHSAVWQTAKPF